MEMLTIIDDRLEIEKAQAKFKKKILQALRRKEIASIGYQGENYEETFYWSPELRMWAVFGKEPNRFWNVFGLLDKPKLPSSNSIDVEINFPFQGINRRISGIVAKDEKGNLFIAHRGIIGGGRKGIGKNFFLDNYRGRWIKIKEGNRESTVALIGMLDSPRFIYQIHNFIQEVKRIKGLSKEKNTTQRKKKHKFGPEFFGEKYIKLSKSEIKAECDHGLIVNTLAGIIEEKHKIKVGNKLYLDLYTTDSMGNISIIFEIKTDSSLSSIYSGIGQLLFNSIALPKKPRLVLVIPDESNNKSDLISRLQKIGIETLYYKWVNHKPTFPELGKIIKKV